jgi:hypothetical protein
VSSELGKVERPDAEPFRSQRKIYLVPLVFPPAGHAPEYADLHERYWRGVREHLLRLETSIGSIARVYHEAVGLGGDEGIETAESISETSGSISRGKVESGAGFEALEDQDLVMESFDWQRCLMVGLESRKVSELAWKSYTDAMNRRYELMARRIDETLKPEEAGLLFVSEDHRIQFPADMKVFFVAPPALDEIHRWLRDQRRARSQPPQPPEEKPES